jgi:hypothetical protein
VFTVQHDGSGSLTCIDISWEIRWFVCILAIFILVFSSRGVIDAGRAGITRARGRVGVHGTNNDDRWDSMKSPSQSLNVNNPSFRRRRGSTDEDVDTSASTEQPDTESRNQHGDRHHGSEDTIAGLLGLDDDFRIVGSQTNNEDEIRDVQLRALSRRIIASPSLAFFPAKKVEYDVM